MKILNIYSYVRGKSRPNASKWGELEKRGEQLWEIGKGGAGQKGGIMIIKGGLETPLETLALGYLWMFNCYFLYLYLRIFLF